MKNLYKITLIAGIMSLVACGSSQQEQANTTADTSMAVQDSTVAPAYTAEMVDNKKDPSCGMPVTAGISDTAHYDNKVLGFCSTECKNEFLKNPKATIAAAELRK
jgi:YHS domain-containing protein